MIEASLRLTGMTRLAGVDEAGRGACAGPLVVAAVILADSESSQLTELRDSKELTPKVRERLYDVIIDSAMSYSIIEISPAEIDRAGVHRANLDGMRRAVMALQCEPEYVLTDGYEIEGLNAPSLAIWKGDQVAPSISAASILAKVARDRLMTALDQRYPQYGFATHKGYITAAHSHSLKIHGPSEIHRHSFANVAALLHT